MSVSDVSHLDVLNKGNLIKSREFTTFPAINPCQEVLRIVSITNTTLSAHSVASPPQSQADDVKPHDWACAPRGGTLSNKALSPSQQILWDNDENNILMSTIFQQDPTSRACMSVLDLKYRAIPIVLIVIEGSF